VLQGDHPVQGTSRKRPVGLRLGFSSDDFGYAIDLGLPGQTRLSTSAFLHDPEIKRECIWNGEILRPSALLVDNDGWFEVEMQQRGLLRPLEAAELSSMERCVTCCGSRRS
jgi:predicted ATPase